MLESLLSAQLSPSTLFRSRCYLLVVFLVGEAIDCGCGWGLLSAIEGV